MLLRSTRQGRTMSHTNRVFRSANTIFISLFLFLCGSSFFSALSVPRAKSLTGVCFAATSEAPVENVATIYDRNIVILYDRSASVVDRIDLLPRVNEYVHKIVTQEFTDDDLQSKDDYLKDVLNTRGLDLPLWRPGDVISFYTFGIDLSALEALGSHTQDDDSFVDGLSGQLIHAAGRFDGRDADDVERAVERTIGGWSKSYDRTLSRYATCLLARKLSAGVPARRVILLMISDFKYGHQEVNIADRGIIQKSTPEYMRAMDNLEKRFAASFEVSNSLLEIQVSREDGIAIMALELTPIGLPHVALQKGERPRPKVKGNTLYWPNMSFGVTKLGAEVFPFEMEQAFLRVRLRHPGQEVLIPVSKISGGLNSPPIKASFKEERAESLISTSGIGYLSLNMLGTYTGREGLQVDFPFVVASREVSVSLSDILAQETRSGKSSILILAVVLGATVILALHQSVLRRPSMDVWMKPEGLREVKHQDMDFRMITWAEGRRTQKLNFVIVNTSRRFVLRPLNAVFKLEGVEDVDPRLAGLEFTLARVDARRQRLGFYHAIARLYPSLQARLGSQQGRGIGSSVYLPWVEPHEPREITIEVTFPRSVRVTEPIIPAFTLNVDIDTGVERTSQKKRITFCVEPDLGNFWLGIDPGTVGSCIAGGTQIDNIKMVSVDGRTVVPSYVYFPEKLTDEGPLSVSNGVKFGGHAEAELVAHPDRCFTSAKRLIGYDWHREISINGNNIDVTGKDVVALLVDFLLSQARDYFLSRSYSESAGLLPDLNKIVVAVPNNFTPYKIGVFKECCRREGIQRVEHIYEAEAVVLSYLKQHDVANKDRDARELERIRREGENILVFDFGGGSLNFCVVSIGPEAAKRKITIYARMGYAIGGDLIDRIFAENVWQQVNSGLEDVSEDPFSTLTEMEDRTRLQENRKLDIGDWKGLRIRLKNFAKTAKENLSTLYRVAGKLQDITPYNADLDLRGRKRSVLLRAEQMLEANDMRDIISTCAEGVREVYQLAREGDFTGAIDTLLIAGRSSLLFNVRETVLETLNSVLAHSGDETGTAGGDWVGNAADDVDPERDAHSDEHREPVEDRGPGEESPLPYVPDLPLKDCVAEGAAYYGVQMNNITLSRHMTFLHYGAKIFRGPSTGNAYFENLISSGTPFLRGKITREIGSVDIRFNNNQVSFFQVAGADPDRVMRDSSQKYKSAILGTCHVKGTTLRAVRMELRADDAVHVSIDDLGGRVELDTRQNILDIRADYDTKAVWPLL